MPIQEKNLTLLKLFFRWQNDVPRRVLEADSFDCSNTFRVPSTINKISDAEINEVSHGHWNNTRNNDNKNGGKYTQKNQYYKSKKDFNRKPWQNKDQKLWNKDHKK